MTTGAKAACCSRSEAPPGPWARPGQARTPEPPRVPPRGPRVTAGGPGAFLVRASGDRLLETPAANWPVGLPFQYVPRAQIPEACGPRCPLLTFLRVQSRSFESGSPVKSKKPKDINTEGKSDSSSNGRLQVPEKGRDWGRDRGGTGRRGTPNSAGELRQSGLRDARSNRE